MFLHTSIGGDERFTEETTATSRLGIDRAARRVLEHDCGLMVFQQACQLGCEGIVSKRLGSRYRSGRSPDWLKFQNPAALAVGREVEEDWGKG